MHTRRTIYIVFFFMGMSLSNMGIAQDKKTSNNEIEELKQKMAEMQRQIDELKKQRPVETEQKISQDETDYLRRLAQSLAAQDQAEQKIKETVFKSGGLSLQALNPEISVTGDMLGYYKHQ